MFVADGDAVADIGYSLFGGLFVKLHERLDQYVHIP